MAKPGYRLISLDYSQVELRILAFVSRDPVLLDLFAKDQDVHRRTASEIFDVATEDVTKEQRDAAKTINFGLLYGMGAHRLAQTLSIPRKEAQNYLDKYFIKYAGVLSWKNESLTVARGERIAINTPIQGTAADIIKKAMIDTDRYIQENTENAHLIMQVHDELIIEAKTEDADKIAQEVAKIMSQGHGLDLNLKVDFGIASNWDDAH